MVSREIFSMDRSSARIEKSTLNLAETKALLLLGNPTFARISEESFDRYDRQQIQKDVLEVATAEGRWVQRGNAESTEGVVLETMLHDMIVDAHWFGNASIRKTSKYDDYFNHIDALLGLHHGGEQNTEATSYIGLGMDVTTSASGLTSKVARIRDHIKSGILGTVRYADIDDFKGEMSKIPEVVLFVDRASFKDVLSLWVTTDMSLQSTFDQRTQSHFNYLAQHKLQIELLMQAYLYHPQLILAG